jgi:hypothetical protein
VTLVFYAEPMQKNMQICKNGFRYSRLNCLQYFDNISLSIISRCFEIQRGTFTACAALLKRVANRHLEAALDRNSGTKYGHYFCSMRAPV